MEASEDDDEFEDDYKDGSSLHDALLRKIGMLRQRCVENKTYKIAEDGVEVVKISCKAN